MKNLIFFYFMTFGSKAFSQNSELPILSYKGNDEVKPLIFYISGDGGWNKFSTSFVKGFNKAGYSVIGLNARSYFWSRKQPLQAATDISHAIIQIIKPWNIKSIVLIGYSFGADVVPFIQNSFPPTVSVLLQQTILMSPSKKTDFEVHVLGMMGLASNKGKNVAEEINKMTKPVTLIFGNDENDFPLQGHPSQNIHIIKLLGGHHYDGNVEEVIRKIMESIR
ncbi:MAG: hypothetical protein NVS9B7_06200 [Flavisolibacter sp.]